MFSVKQDNVLLKGLHFIHTSHLKFHGGLTSEVCLINDRYTLRIAQAGFVHLTTILRGDSDVHHDKRERIALYQTGDIFAFGQILTSMFHTENESGRTEMNLTSALQKMMEECLSRDPQQRPTAAQLKTWTHKMGLSDKSLVQLLLNRLKGHADELESEVQARSADLLEERRKLDDLLREMLPRFVRIKLCVSISSTVSL